MGVRGVMGGVSHFLLMKLFLLCSITVIYIIVRTRMVPLAWVKPNMEKMVNLWCCAYHRGLWSMMMRAMNFLPI